MSVVPCTNVIANSDDITSFSSYVPDDVDDEELSFNDDWVASLSLDDDLTIHTNSSIRGTDQRDDDDDVDLNRRSRQDYVDESNRDFFSNSWVLANFESIVDHKDNHRCLDKYQHYGIVSFVDCSGLDDPVHNHDIDITHDDRSHSSYKDIVLESVMFDDGCWEIVTSFDPKLPVHLEDASVGSLCSTTSSSSTLTLPVVMGPPSLPSSAPVHHEPSPHTNHEVLLHHIDEVTPIDKVPNLIGTGSILSVPVNNHHESPTRSYLEVLLQNIGELTPMDDHPNYIGNGSMLSVPVKNHHEAPKRSYLEVLLQNIGDVTPIDTIPNRMGNGMMNTVQKKVNSMIVTTMDDNYYFKNHHGRFFQERDYSYEIEESDQYDDDDDDMLYWIMEGVKNSRGGKSHLWYKGNPKQTKSLLTNHHHPHGMLPKKNNHAREKIRRQLLQGTSHKVPNSDYYGTNKIVRFYYNDYHHYAGIPAYYDYS